MKDKVYVRLECVCVWECVCCLIGFSLNKRG